MSILDIDWGNSRLKWRLSGSAGIDSEGATESVASNALQEISAAINSVPVRVRVASVKGDESSQELQAAIQSLWGVEAEFAETRSESCGVTNSYSKPHTMGVDRWCGIVAAKKLYSGAYCVVSFGSAVTVDFVDATGVHRGGYIVPGVKMQVMSLLSGTGKVFFDGRSFPEKLLPGDNTSDAVISGVLASLVAFVEREIAQFKSSMPGQELSVALTGGQAPLMQRYLSVPSELKPGLVLDGLGLILP